MFSLCSALHLLQAPRSSSLTSSPWHCLCSLYHPAHLPVGALRICLWPQEVWELLTICGIFKLAFNNTCMFYLSANTVPIFQYLYLGSLLEFALKLSYWPEALPPWLKHHLPSLCGALPRLLTPGKRLPSVICSSRWCLGIGHLSGHHHSPRAVQRPGKDRVHSQLYPS